MARRRLTVKRIDPWSVLKFGFLVNLSLLAVVLLGAIVVWFFVNQLDLIERACSIAGQLGFENCGVDGGNLFRALLLLGLLGVIVATGLLVFFSFLFNLISDLVGGLEASVVDEAAGSARPSPRTAASVPGGGDRSAARSGGRSPAPRPDRAGRSRGRTGAGDAGSGDRDRPPVPPLGTEPAGQRPAPSSRSPSGGGGPEDPIFGGRGSGGAGR